VKVGSRKGIVSRSELRDPRSEGGRTVKKENSGKLAQVSTRRAIQAVAGLPTVGHTGAFKG